MSEDKRVWFEQFRAAKRNAIVLKHDCRKRLAFPNASVDHIVCSHFLEHVYPPEAVAIIKDFHRVLRKGGTLHLIVPDLHHLVDSYVMNATRDPTAADKLIDATILTQANRPSFLLRVLEFIGYEGMRHRWMYNYSSLAACVTKAGFELLERNMTPSSEVRANDGNQSLHIVAQKTN